MFASRRALIRGQSCRQSRVALSLSFVVVRRDQERPVRPIMLEGEAIRAWNADISVAVSRDL